jgi:hypothetical protein
MIKICSLMKLEISCSIIKTVGQKYILEWGEE